MASPFDPTGAPPNIPDTCRTAEVFRKLYAGDISKLFTSQNKDEFYEKINNIVPLDRCFCYFRDLGIEPKPLKNNKHISDKNRIPVTYEDHPYLITLTKLKTVNSPTLAKELEYELKESTVKLRPLLANILISYMVNYTFLSKLKVASSLHLYGASICPKIAVQFYEYPNGDTLSNFVSSPNTKPLLLKHGYLQQISHKTLIRRDLFQGILLQIFTALSYLQTQLKFHHNNLTAKTTYISFVLDETTGKMRFQTKLANFQKSSITTSNQKTSFTLVSRESSSSSSSSSSSTTSSETDIYTLIFSLLTLEPFFNTFFHLFDTNSTFYKLWNLLFPDPQTSEKYIKKISPNTLTPVTALQSDQQTNKNRKLIKDIIAVLKTPETSP